ncbi:MAG TPA: potassium channel family protein, partial [Methanocorpusculum sp.]|nr:potassium channel family protein [Methanocorpusculum sp.]
AIIRKLKVPFISASIFVLLFIIFAAAIMLFVEPQTFNESFLNALYWSVITCTTVGYGDIHPVSAIGKVLTMLGSFVSVIIISLPVSVITAGITATVMTNMRKYNNNHKSAEMNRLTPIEPDSKDSEDATEEGVNFCPQCGRECGPADNYCKSCGWKLK